MTVTISVFEASPDGGKGLARDMPVRWALEECGIPYTARPLSFDAMKKRPHLDRQPFGQIPTYEDGALTLFESGAIVLHVAEQGDLLPSDPQARSRAIMWMFAAQSTIEPPVVEREMAFLTESEKPWFKDRLKILDARLDARLGQLSARLSGNDWLEGGFSAGDLMMISVLRRLEKDLAAHPILQAYVARGEARPAFGRAFAAQKAVCK